MSFHILTTNLYNALDAEVAILEVDATAIEAIRKARKFLRKFEGKYPHTAALMHRGTYTVHFLKGLPEGWIDEACPDDVSMLESPMRLAPEFDMTTMLEQADEQDLYVRSVLTGLKIYVGGLYIIGDEKHADNNMESDDISDLIPEAVVSIVTA